MMLRYFFDFKYPFASRSFPDHNYKGSVSRLYQKSRNSYGTYINEYTKDQDKSVKNIYDAPTLGEFMGKNFLSTKQNEQPISVNTIPYLDHDPNDYGEGRNIYIENYGCQMNVNDSQIVHGIMSKSGYGQTLSAEDADIIFLNTCSIRDHAEQKIWSRLGELRKLRKQNKNLIIGILGCMAERLKENILEREKLVDIIAGPDSYRDLPCLLSRVRNNKEKIVQVLLSQDETYADISPVRIDDNGISAFISISRGCNQHCTYCIVPRTRGVERHRPLSSIINEVRELSEKGYKEITLLGQNVNSYNDKNHISSQEQTSNLPSVELARGFKTVYRTPKAGLTFSELIKNVCEINPEMRIRFTSPHPKDFPDSLLHVIRDFPNVCKSIHIPAQSGSTVVLERMRRGYTREVYLELISNIRQIVGDEVALSSDFISGFCGETHEQHLETVSLLELVKYDQAFMFLYSMRERTPAHRRYEDDIPLETKKQRLHQMIECFQKNIRIVNSKLNGTLQLVLIENQLKKDPNVWMGRNDGNKKVYFNPKFVPTLQQYISGYSSDDMKSINIKPGDYVVVKTTGNRGTSLLGDIVAITTLTEFTAMKKKNIIRTSEIN